MEFHINPALYRLWLTAAVCWPLAWMLFMHLSPGPLAPPAPPSAPVSTGPSSRPPVDLSGSQGVPDSMQGSIVTSSGVRMFWEIPEPGHVRGRLELDPEALPDNPLVVVPDASQP